MPRDDYYRRKWADRWLRDHPGLPPRNCLNRFTSHGGGSSERLGPTRWSR